MDGVDIIMQESIFINFVLEEIVPKSSTQELLETGDGATQEPASTCLTLEIAKELDAEADAIPQEPASTSKWTTTQTGVSTQSRDVRDRGKELEVIDEPRIDEVEKFFQCPSYFSIPRGARVSRSP